MQTLKEIYEYRQMIASLVKKDLRGRYKGSVLGFLWTFVNPLLQLLIYSVVFSSVMRVTNVDKYYLFLFVALIPWIFFSSCLTGGATAILGNQSMITKIYFPREVLPIAYVNSCFVNMLYSFIVVFIVVIISGVGINPVSLLFLPLVMLVEYIFALGMAMIVSAVNVYFRDLQHILGIVTMAWMYFTPVLYDLDIIPPQWVFYFKLNPMCHVITAYRDILYYKNIPDVIALLETGAVSSIVLVIGFAVFSKLKRRFAETV